jgi:excisionase family DNA binding protein
MRGIVEESLGGTTGRIMDSGLSHDAFDTMWLMNGLTTKEAAELIGVSEQTVKGWLRRGYLRQALPGPTHRLLPEDVYDAQRNAHAGDLVPRWREDPSRAGSRLRELRERAGLNQQQLAARAGITHERVSRLEHGQWAPKAATIVALSQALGCDPKQFVSSEPIGPRTLSTTEAAGALGVPVQRLQVWLQDGTLPSTKIGGRWRIPAVAVSELDRSGRLRGVSRRLDPRYRG